MENERKPKVLLLAGEESGVLYARRLAEILQSRGKGVALRTYETEGFKIADLAVMGFWPVLRRLGFFLGVAKTMKRVIAEWRPDVVVTIDYPGMNLKLAAYAKARGIPAVHLVCPQVWAWHKNRIPKVAAALTKLLCFFPFEPKLFEGCRDGFEAKFIGHPLVDVFAEERAKAGEAEPSGGARRIAILPGSRIGEIQRNLPRLLKAVEILAREVDSPLEVTIPCASDKAELEVRSIVGGSALAVHLQRGAREVLKRADVAAVASGTATLEAALARCPTVLVYAVSPLLAWFARRVIKEISHIGLANVIWEKSGNGGEFPMPELLQEAFTPEAVAEQLKLWLQREELRQAAIARLDASMALLHSDGNALGLAADEILGAIGG